MSKETGPVLIPQAELLRMFLESARWAKSVTVNLNDGETHEYVLHVTEKGRSTIKRVQQGKL